jgi:hypothetical protein
MQTSHLTYDADSCLSPKELGACTVSIVHQPTPTLATLRSTRRWRLVLNESAWESRLPEKGSSEIIML